ncbi:hypothetical protein ACSBR1_024468 [Camellia fascicularis]
MKNSKLELEEDHQSGLELLKAVAQAWHGHSSCSRPASEFDARRLNFKSMPTRFKLEAMKEIRNAHWDFGQSLWDSYEIVTVSKRIEAGLVLDHEFPVLDDSSMSHKKNKQSKNSLRKLFNWMS